VLREVRRVDDLTWRGVNEQTPAVATATPVPAPAAPLPAILYDPPELVTAEELAILLDCGERSVWRMVRDGRLPPPEPKPLRPRLWRTAEALTWWPAR
jgi:hypothetical protein